ncbi:MAG: 4-phosphoerythronate dehydrogenase [Gammaproteobacteria bacterium]|nr:4-phosphoerythronate dehydrogenase [Gammaproteobacteria bacterium]MCP5199415.1 4-phosphoerythronate dehydrogenase [Gammaproteobacteria bacterium]
MEILVDREIPGAASVFADFGRARLFEGRSLAAADLGDAEVLLVRSVTRVDGGLLAGSRVRFVGTATAGVDHVDTAWLAAQGIAFSAAAGCNARAVAEHVLCCVYAWAARRRADARELSLGIIGCGHVGGELHALASALGIAVRANDPPLGGRAGAIELVDLDAVLGCDVVSLHVPFTGDGAHPTRDLVDARRVAALRPGTLVINAARGGVLNEAALVARLVDGELGAALDCWAGEPALAPVALAASTWATPHIAGHSREARARASLLLHRALARWLERDCAPPAELALAPAARLEVDRGGIVALLARIHPLAAHTARLRALGALAPAQRAALFDAQRRHYGLRREFGAYTVACPGADADTVAQLVALGFKTA